MLQEGIDPRYSGPETKTIRSNSIAGLREHMLQEGIDPRYSGPETKLSKMYRVLGVSLYRMIGKEHMHDY